LLGTHVARSPERQTSLSDPSTTGLSHSQGDPEISYDRTAVVEQNVLGLDVPVDDVVPVRIVKGTRDFSCDSDRVGDGELLLLVESLAKGLTFDIRHDVIRPTLQLTYVLADESRVNQPKDVGVLQIGGDSDLLEESLCAQDRRQLGVQNLDSDLAVVFLVVRKIDGRHAAAAQLALDEIGGERPPNRFEALSHFVPAS
jgi:hypothetical protein